MNTKPKDGEQLSEGEIQRRLDRALKKSVTMPPKPHDTKTKPRKMKVRKKKK